VLPRHLPQPNPGRSGVSHFFMSPTTPTTLLFIAMPLAAGSSTGNSTKKEQQEKATGRSGGKHPVGKKGWKEAVAYCKRALGVRYDYTSCHELPVFPIGSCRAGARMGVPAHLLCSHPHRRGFRATGADVLSVPSPNNTPTPF
jgi:hypothetical protein